MTDFAGILRVLLESKVDFILVGGVAAVAHGSARATYDVDAVYDRSRENIARLAEALAPLKPYLRGAPPGLPFRWDAETIAHGLNFTLTTLLGDLDLLGEIVGGGGYRDLRAPCYGATVVWHAVPVSGSRYIDPRQARRGPPKRPRSHRRTGGPPRGTEGGLSVLASQRRRASRLSRAIRAARCSPLMSLICSCQSKRRFSTGSDRVEYLVDGLLAEQEGFRLDHGVRFLRVRGKGVMDPPRSLLEVEASRPADRVSSFRSSGHLFRAVGPLDPPAMIGSNFVRFLAEVRGGGKKGWARAMTDFASILRVLHERKSAQSVPRSALVIRAIETRQRGKS